MEFTRQSVRSNDPLRISIRGTWHDLRTPPGWIVTQQHCGGGDATAHTVSRTLSFNPGGANAAENMVVDLVVIAKWIAECRNSQTWQLASRGNGPFVKQVVDRLTRCRPSEFVPEMFVALRPEIDTRHKGDDDKSLLAKIAVRAVAAHLVLASFFNQLLRFRVEGELLSAEITKHALENGLTLLEAVGSTCRSAFNVTGSNGDDQSEFAANTGRRKFLRVVGNEAIGRRNCAALNNDPGKDVHHDMLMVVAQHEPVFSTIVHDLKRD